MSLLLFCFIVSAVQAEVTDRYQFDDDQQQILFKQLLKELRCLVCQNQDLSDSNASLAEDLRQEVYALVVRDHNKEEILNFLTDRYGDFILFKPPLKATTYVLWIGPFVLLILAVFLLLRFVRRQA
ncbi:MAG: cytochrome c-type biogenesis protein [Gammaproteobacteria bacterium]